LIDFYLVNYLKFTKHFFFLENTFFLKKEPVLKLFLQAKTFTKNIRFFDQTFFVKESLLVKLFFLRKGLC